MALVQDLTSIQNVKKAEALAERLIDPIYKSMPIVDSIRVPETLAGVAGVIDDGEVVGVVHWSADVDTQLVFRAGGADDLADAFGRDIRGLQNIAVAADRQGEGIGLALSEHFLEAARRDGIKTVIGVSTGGSATFFAKAGYTVLDPGETLMLPFSPVGVVPLTIDSPSSWFFRDL